MYVLTDLILASSKRLDLNERKSYSVPEWVGNSDVMLLMGRTGIVQYESLPQ